MCLTLLHGSCVCKKAMQLQRENTATMHFQCVDIWIYRTFHAFIACFEVQFQIGITICCCLYFHRSNITFGQTRTFIISKVQNISGTAQESSVVQGRFRCVRFLLYTPTDLHPPIDGALHQDDLVLPTSRLEYFVQTIFTNVIYDGLKQ